MITGRPERALPLFRLVADCDLAAMAHKRGAEEARLAERALDEPLGRVSNEISFITKSPPSSAMAPGRQKERPILRRRGSGGWVPLEETREASATIRQQLDVPGRLRP